MVTVAEIAKEAFDAVAAEITDAIHAATLTRTVQGAYDPATGTYATTSDVQTGRMVVDTVKPAKDIFAGYVAGPGDELILLEGMTSCEEGSTMTAGGDTWHVLQVQDIVAAGSLFYVIARRVL